MPCFGSVRGNWRSGAVETTQRFRIQSTLCNEMPLSPVRHPSAGDSVRAADVAHELRAALGPYQDTTAAVRDGYRMFMPQVKEQKVYHFTNNWRAVQEAFRFDPAKPTSLLYKKGAD